MKFYVVGLGSIGMRHAQNLLALGHEVYGWDTEKIVRERAEAAHIKIWRGDEYDALVIATPTKNHLEYMVKINKPMFVEKPIAHYGQLEEAERFIKVGRWNSFEEAPLIAVGNNLRFHPSVQALKRQIVENKFGAPTWAFLSCAQYNEKPDYLRDGVTLNWGAHEIDLALYLFGPARVEAYSVDKNDTIADLCLTHGEFYGTRTNIHLDYLTAPEMRSTMVFGPKGQAVVDLPARILTCMHGEKTQSWLGTGSYDLDYLNEMQAFADAVEGKAPWPGATANEALEVLKIIKDAKKITRP